MGAVARVAVPALLVGGAVAATAATGGAAAPAVLGGTGAFVNAAGVTVGAGTAAGAAGGLLTAGNAALGLSALSGLASTFAAYRGAEAQKASARYEAAAASRNAELAGLEAADALRRGADAEARHRLQVAQLDGRQRNALAANGIALDSGSALDVLGDTAALGELDALTIRLNAEREAWAARTGAAGLQGQAALAQAEASGISPATAAGTSLLGGASAFADRWYRVRGA